MSEQKTGGFFHGFIFGLLIGGGLVFLFGTAKGKKVLQMLLDQVEENTAISELLEMPEEEDEEYIMGMEEPTEEEFEKEEPRHEESKSSKPVARVKRFFKGAPKKMVS